MASNRGDILQTSNKYSSKLLQLNIILLVFLLIVLFVVTIAELKFNIVSNPKETVKLVACTVAVVETLGFSCLAIGSGSVSTYSVKLKFGDRVRNLIKAFVIFFISCAVVHIITVLYGAPVFENVEETFLFSLLLSSLTIIPCLSVIGMDSEAWKRLYFEREPETESEWCLMYLVVSTYVGAWLGAIPIPLDWERPWQEWPVTVCVGALLGHTAGVVLSICHLLYHMTGQNKPFKFR